MEIRPYEKNNIFSSYVSIFDGKNEAIVKSYGKVSAFFRSLIGGTVTKTVNGTTYHLDKLQYQNWQNKAAVSKAVPINPEDLSMQVKADGEIRKMLNFQSEAEVKAFLKALTITMNDPNVQSARNLELEKNLVSFCNNKIALFKFPEAESLVNQNNQFIANVVQLKGQSLVQEILDRARAM